jgi:hypothetical protein
MLNFLSKRVTPVAPLDRVLTSVRRNPEALQREIGEHVRSSMMVTQENALQIGCFQRGIAPLTPRRLNRTRRISETIALAARFLTAQQPWMESPHL